ncbi:hypothetical protein HMPREF7215_2467 [Pyramidobacter piscolens W5455]|uniref:Uncharacterized protein n=1 Tax=Pyramidobacter piscolens W5455 TaxID=352165 RepID=A0ABP2HV99_9BACT|nr:hypothetical protein HMPREF7215_2467 [Pyramidobacter piscolens W5455]
MSRCFFIKNSNTRAPHRTKADGLLQRGTTFFRRPVPESHRLQKADPVAADGIGPYFQR